jgi:hypothetical protein
LAESLPISKPVANPAHGDNELCLGGIIAELFAQISDMDINDMIIAKIIGTPHTIKQLGAGKSPARVCRQGAQQIILKGRQAQRRTSKGCLVASVIDQECAKLQWRWERHLAGIALAGAAQHRTHTGNQFAWRKRFGQIIVGTNL